MGGYLLFLRIGKVMEASAIGVVLLLLAVWGGKLVHENSTWSHWFAMKDITLAWAIIFYGLAASILPVWLLLAPRDYLSTFMKLGTIFALAVGIFLVLPHLHMPAISRFVDGSGLVVAGKVFPFCFITIACGAISGFHTLIASGTTPKIITRETYARPIGYGAMCLESLVAIMALIAACTLDPGVYLSINVKGDAAATVAKINSLGFPVTTAHMSQLAADLGEKTLFGRTGGASTLAVGMANIFSQVVKGRGLDLWYHFAIMFEALFILTTLDAGTRVGRYLLQDVLGNFWKPMGETKNIRANVIASLLVVCGWGYFLIQGVRDPLGGINSLWPLFGIANQLLATVALCLATIIILKMTLVTPDGVPTPDKSNSPVFRSPAFALVTLVPLLWLLAVTGTAGVQKIFHSNPNIGFLAQAKVLEEKAPGLEQALTAAKVSGVAESIRQAEKALSNNRVLRFNNLMDAAVAGIFLVLVGLIVLLSGREAILLLARRKLAVLRESQPVWLADYALVEARPLHLVGMIALALAFAKEISGQAAVDRAQPAQIGGHHEILPCCSEETHGAQAASAQYLEATERRFNGINRCC